MNCMKCGVELKDSGVFCESCLKDMERYPVKPNITVQIPRRPVSSAPKRKIRRQRQIKPEEQILRLKKVRNLLAALLFVALLAFAACAMMVLHLLDQEEVPNIGQNYETFEHIGSR